MTTTKTKKTNKPKIRCLVKTHGGKAYLARKLVDLMPSQISTYCEPFIGGGSVFLNLPSESYSQAIIGDLAFPTYALWRAMQDEYLSFFGTVFSLPYTEETFNRCLTNPTRYTAVSSGIIDVAVQEYVLRRMSRGGLGKTFAWSERLRGGKPGDVNAWETAIEQLPLIHQHLITSNTFIVCGPAQIAIQAVSHDPNALIYADPPYVPTTRTARKVYDHEMTVEQHADLLDHLLQCKCRVMISGYDCVLYRDKLSGWRRTSFDLPNNSGQGEIKNRRTEVVWMNWENNGQSETQRN